IPPYWIRPPQRLATEPGMHRCLWDFHYTLVPGVTPQYPIAAVYRNTAPEATSPWAMPGDYKIVLTVGSKKYEQTLKVVMDPRVKTSMADLGEQFKLSKQMYDEWMALNSISEDVRKLRGQVTDLRPKVTDANLKAHLDAFADKLQAFAGGGGGAAANARPTVASTMQRARTLFNLIEEVDLAPTPQVASAIPEVVKDSKGLQDNWRTIQSQDLSALNQELKAAGLPALH